MAARITPISAQPGGRAHAEQRNETRPGTSTPAPSIRQATQRERQGARYAVLGNAVRSRTFPIPCVLGALGNSSGYRVGTDPGNPAIGRQFCGSA